MFCNDCKCASVAYGMRGSHRCPPHLPCLTRMFCIGGTDAMLRVPRQRLSSLVRLRWLPAVPPSRVAHAGRLTTLVQGPRCPGERELVQLTRVPSPEQRWLSQELSKHPGL